MQGLTEDVLVKIEKAHSEGISSQQIVTVFESYAVPFSEATLRKYVQLGLLPHSVRVGRKGAHRGSLGIYPVAVVRQVVEIKRLLAENYSIDEIRQEFLLLRGDIDALEQKLAELFDGIEVAIASRPTDTVAEHARRDLKDVRGSAVGLIDRLRALETRISARARLARAAR